MGKANTIYGQILVEYSALHQCLSVSEVHRHIFKKERNNNKKNIFSSLAVPWPPSFEATKNIFIGKSQRSLSINLAVLQMGGLFGLESENWSKVSQLSGLGQAKPLVLDLSSLLCVVVSLETQHNYCPSPEENGRQAAEHLS